MPGKEAKNEVKNREVTNTEVTNTELLSAIKTVSDRLAGVEENFGKRMDGVEDEVVDIKKAGGSGNGHKVLLTKRFYEADEKGILEVSRISNTSPRPLSLALTGAVYRGRDIQSGKMTFTQKRIENWLRLQLSAYGGWNREKSFDILKEVVAAEKQDLLSSPMEYEAGG